MKLFNKMRQQKLLSMTLLLATLSIGIVIGTYSSIFVATPIAIDLHKKSELESTTF